MVLAPISSYIGIRSYRAIAGQKMRKTQVMSVAIEIELRAALREAAEADGRSISNYIDRVLRRHLVAHGHLAETSSRETGSAP